MTAKLTDFRPDPKNLNKGTERGNYALERSLRDYGFARPIVADKDGTILAGNHAFEKAGEIGLKKIRVIETDGDEIIVHKRTDLDANTAKARMVALADNRTTEINLAWDASEFKDLLQETPDVKNFFADTELEDLIDATGEINFEPELDPTIGATRTTDDDVEKGRLSMEDSFDNAGEQDIVDVCCPHCGKAFGLARSEFS